MNLKAMLGAIAALVIAVAGTAFLAVQSVKPKAVEPAAVVMTASEKGEYTLNPFDLGASGPQPKAVAKDTFFKFGTMTLGTEQSHEFEFKNEGDAPLKLAKGPLMCKCTMPAVTDQEIQPGESVKITLTWKPLEPSNEFKKDAVIWTNDPLNSKVVLSIEGSVFPDPMLVPESFVLGEVPYNRESIHTIYLYSPISEDLKVEPAEVSHPEWMGVECEHVPNSDLAKMASPSGPLPKSGWAAKLTIKPHSEVGTFAGWIKVKTNRSSEPVKIDVTGTRSGPISIHSEAYQANRTLIDLKRFKSAEGKSVKLFLFLEPFEQDLKIESVKSDSGNLSATLVKEKPSGKRDRYTLIVEAKPRINPGTTYTIDNPDTLTIMTNHPQAPSFVFKSRYIVQ